MDVLKRGSRYVDEDTVRWDRKDCRAMELSHGKEKPEYADLELSKQ